MQKGPCSTSFPYPSPSSSRASANPSLPEFPAETKLSPDPHYTDAVRSLAPVCTVLKSYKNIEILS
ncbi:hypothetical protein AAY473_015021 [Plecturocebus cupreus]